MKKTFLTMLFMVVASLSWAQHKFELSQNTSNGDWTFTNGCSISNSSGKTYAPGSSPTIKYSKGVQYTINIPNGVAIKSVSFSGYDNYADVDAYIAEVGGKTYEASTYVFPMRENEVAVNKTYTITLASPATGTLTFTPTFQ